MKPLSKAVLFVVDDEPSVRRAMGRLLASVGFQVELFGSGEEVLEAIVGRRVRPDCLILDVHLRGMNGFELQDRLRARGWEVPTVFMTAVEFVRSVGEGWRERFPPGLQEASLLLKPFDDQALLERITRALGPAEATRPSGGPSPDPGPPSALGA